MDIGSIFLILALLIPVVIFISRPLLEPRPDHGASTNQDISALLASRDQIVAAIQDLDDDYTLGKVPEQIYTEKRQALLENGVVVLRQIDSYQVTSDGLTSAERLEEAIMTRRLALETTTLQAKKNGNAVPPVPDDELEQRIASRRREMNEKAGGFCPKCGRPVHASDRFCPKCGAALV